MMTEFNPVNLKQGAGFPGVPNKLLKGNTGGEPEQPMSFVCVMGNACRTTTQKTGENSLNFRPGKGKIGGHPSKGDAVRRGGTFDIDPENNILNAGKYKTGKTNQSLNDILSAGKGETEKTNQSLPVKGKCIAESSHGAILKGEATKAINLFMNASKGRGVKTNRSFSGKDGVRGQRAEVGGQTSEVRGHRAEMSDVPGLLKFSLKNAAAVKGKSAVEPAGMEKNTEKNSFTPVNSSGKNDIGNSLKPLGLNGEAKAVVGKDEAQVRVGLPKGSGGLIGPFGKRALDSGIRNGKNDTVLFKDVKNVAAVLRDGGLKGNGAGKDEVRGQKSEGKGQKAEMEERQGLLKFSLKNAAAVKGKSAAEPAMTEKNTEKNSFTPVNSGGKNNIGNLLKPLGLNGEETIKIPHRGTPQPESPSVRNFSAGGYHTTFHAGSSSAVINESVSSHGIEPRALINQIASGVKSSGRVRITLNPPSLGTLDVDVLVRDNKVHVILQTENNDVRHILQSNMESLKSSLRNHGLVADDINVLVQEKSDGADYRSRQNETLFKESGNRGGNKEDQDREQNSLNHNSSSSEEKNQRVRSDEHVSLFA